MSMSKKDFIALADMLRTARTNVVEREGNKIEIVEEGYNPFKQEHIEFLADFCESQNPRFMRDRWLDYISGKVGPGGGRL